MMRALITLGLAVVCAGCAAGSGSGRSVTGAAAAAPRARCLVDPNESGTRPLFFLFCIQSP